MFPIVGCFDVDGNWIRHDRMQPLAGDLEVLVFLLMYATKSRQESKKDRCMT